MKDIIPSETRKAIGDELRKLREIADASREVRHPLQFLNPMWKGKPLADVLNSIAYNITAELLKMEND